MTSMGRCPAGRYLTGRCLAGRYLAGRCLAGRYLAGRCLAGRCFAGRCPVGRWSALLALHLALLAAVPASAQRYAEGGQGEAASAQSGILTEKTRPREARRPVVLELTEAQVARLGLEWTTLTPVPEFAIASAPAVVVVPPSQESVVSAPVGGLVTRLLVAEGSEVEAGEPLVELRSTELLGLEREYVEATAARRLAEAQLERDRGLRADGIIAQRRLDETQAQAAAARVRAEQASQQLRLAGLSDAKLRALAASGRISADLTLEAPFAGTVVARYSALGQQVQALEPVARVADLSLLWIEAHVPQERADAITPGMRISIDSRYEPVTAEVFQVGRVVDAVTQTVLVRGRVDNADGLLRAGQSLPARILAGAGVGEALAAPVPAIVRLDGRAYVFARRPAGFELLPVRIIGDDGARVYLDAADLDESTEIATRGVSALKSLLLSTDEQD